MQELYAGFLNTCMLETKYVGDRFEMVVT